MQILRSNLTNFISIEWSDLEVCYTSGKTFSTLIYQIPGCRPQNQELSILTCLIDI